MSERLEAIEKRIKALDMEIDEARRRLPAHSPKPQVVMMLLELEDEQAELIRKRDNIKKSNQGISS